MSIQAMTLAKFSARVIAEKLNFHVSSIYLELNRGKSDQTSLAIGYRAVRAHDRACKKRVSAGAARRKLGLDLKTPLWRTVIDGLRFVTPGQRHDGHDHTILAARHVLYLKARERHPARWSGATRDWTPTGPVTLNPERDSVIAAHSTADDRQPLAA